MDFKATTSGRVEYKFVKVSSSGSDWEDGSNRHFDLGAVSGVAASGSSELFTPRFGRSGGAAPRLQGISRTDTAIGFERLVAEQVDRESESAPRGTADASSSSVPAPVPKPVSSPVQTITFDPPARRSSSLSLLADTGVDTLVTGHWLRLKEHTGAAQREQVLRLTLKDLSLEEAEQINVQVIFKVQEANDTWCVKMLRTGYEEKESQAIWSIPLQKVGVARGLHFFHFTVNGVPTLSHEHFIMGNWNAIVYNDLIRRYVLARNSAGGSEELAVSKRAHADAASITQVGGGGLRRMSTSEKLASEEDSVGPSEPGTRTGQLARPWSICCNLQGLGEDDEDEKEQDTGNNISNFSPDVFEGLFDGELRLRSDGLVMPDTSPTPPVNFANTDEGTSDKTVPLRFWAAAHLLKKKTGACEDAFFVDPHGLGVADGVGCMVQFASYGINAAAYAAELMEHAAAALGPGGCADIATTGSQSPEDRACLALSAAETQAKAYGASTITVLVHDGDRIGVSNLGDSGYMLLRKAAHGMTVVHRSEEQQHSWNCPYQLTRLPPVLLKRFPKLSLDTAADSDTYSASIREGDLILMFSDGLRDNLHEREVLHIVDRALSPAFADLLSLPDQCTPPEIIARALALAAQERSMDPTAKVPFVEYSRRHGFDCLGGKQDDITVVAAWVVAEEFALDSVGQLDVRKILHGLQTEPEPAPLINSSPEVPQVTNAERAPPKVRAPTNFESTPRAVPVQTARKHWSSQVRAELRPMHKKNSDLSKSNL